MLFNRFVYSSIVVFGAFYQTEAVLLSAPSTPEKKSLLADEQNAKADNFFKKHKMKNLFQTEKDAKNNVLALWRREKNIGKTDRKIQELKLEVVKNPPNGHCQYQAMQQALGLVGTVTVDELRTMVSSEAENFLAEVDPVYAQQVKNSAVEGLGVNSCGPSCYGDNGSLQILASIFGVHVHVLDSMHDSEADAGTTNDPSKTIYLRLQKAHYEWLKPIGVARPTSPIGRSYQQYKNEQKNNPVNKFYEKCMAILEDRETCTAILAGKNNDVKQAMVGLYEMLGMDVPEEDEEDKHSEKSSDEEDEFLANCQSMGFPPENCKQCLRRANGDMNQAMELLLTA